MTEFPFFDREVDTASGTSYDRNPQYSVTFTKGDFTEGYGGHPAEEVVGTAIPFDISYKDLVVDISPR